MGNAKNQRRRNYSRKKNKRLDRRKGAENIPKPMDDSDEEMLQSEGPQTTAKASFKNNFNKISDGVEKVSKLYTVPKSSEQQFLDPHKGVEENTLSEIEVAGEEHVLVDKSGSQDGLLKNFTENLLCLHESCVSLPCNDSFDSINRNTDNNFTRSMSVGENLFSNKPCDVFTSACRMSDESLHACRNIEPQNDMHASECFNSLQCGEASDMLGDGKGLSSEWNSLHVMNLKYTCNDSVTLEQSKLTNSKETIPNIEWNECVNKNVHAFNVVRFNNNCNYDSSNHNSNNDNDNNRICQSTLTNFGCEESTCVPIRNYSKLCKRSLKMYQAKSITDKISGNRSSQSGKIDASLHKYPNSSSTMQMSDNDTTNTERHSEQSMDSSDDSVCSPQNGYYYNENYDGNCSESEKNSSNCDRTERKEFKSNSGYNYYEEFQYTSDSSHGGGDESDTDEADSILSSRDDRSSSDESQKNNDQSKNKSYNEEVKKKGRRISDFFWVFDQLHLIFDNHHPSCPGLFRDLQIIRVFDQGLRSLITYKCKNCGKTAEVWTDPERPKDRMSLNEAATLGTLISGTGFTALEEQLTAMDIPCMTHVTYRKYRNEIGKTIYNVSKEEIKRAGQLELEAARKAGDIIKGRNDQPDRPFITVIVDGAWSKRSYKGGRYDALSGTAVIIGKRTGLILWCGIRNKGCTGCERNSQHDCVKNWGRDQTSTSMETDIITEGFRKSIETHGLIYKYVIGDGDSSVYKSIIDNDPYAEYSVRVEKIECKNHLFRNFCNHIEEIAKKTKFLSPVSRGSVKGIREDVKTSALKMRVHIEKAMVRRNDEDGTVEEKASRLLTDINNTPCHIFGEHENCEKNANGELNEICKSISKNNVEFYKKIGIFREVENQLSRLALNVSSLLINLTSNAAELYNSIANKFHGGRRINNSMSNSFELRALCAMIQFNNNAVLSVILNYLKLPVSKIVVQMEQSRLKQNGYTRKYRENGGRKRRRHYGTDKDYGPFASTADVSLLIYNLRKDDHLKKLKERQLKRDDIQKETIAQSTCSNWYMYRADIITASHFGEICNKRESTSCAGIVKKIRFSPQLSTESILFGRENEGKAVEELEKKIKKKIIPCGLFIDKDIEFLGASPDGLIDDDGIIEIKCFASAKNLTPNDAIKSIRHYGSIFKKTNINEMSKTHKYYYQVQGQLHITERKYCLFTVWTPLGIKYVNVPKDDEFWKTKMEPKLTKFFIDCLLPEIVDSRLARKMPIRDPDYILKAKETATKKKAALLEKKTRQKRTTTDGQSHPKRTKRMPEVYDSPRNDTVPSDVASDNDSVSNHFHSGSNQWVPLIDDPSNLVDKDQRACIDIVRSSISTENVVNNIRDSKVMLNDESIEYFLQILADNSIYSTFPVLYTVISSLITPSETDQDLQIVGGNTSGHWTCLYYNGDNIYIYDSLSGNKRQGLSSDERVYIRNRYPWITTEEIIYKNVTKQGNDLTICGVYAAAFATSIALGEDPSTVNYSLSSREMRDHLIEIIQKKELSLFPKQDNE